MVRPYHAVMSLQYRQAAVEDNEELLGAEDHIPHLQHAEDIYRDLDAVLELMNIETYQRESPTLIKEPPLILCTSRLDCIRCPPNTPYRSLRRRVEPITARVLTRDFRWRKAMVFAAHCRSCRSDYYPDRITYHDESGRRQQTLEYTPKYLRISKHGLWCDRSFAFAQESATNRFHAGWANFANWINDQVKEQPRMTYRQAQRLFVEHFSRRLLIAHQKAGAFSCPANPKVQVLAASVRNLIGVDGGVLVPSLHHGCMDCTHCKRYRIDLVNEGADLDENVQAMAGEDQLMAEVSLVASASTKTNI